MVAATMMMACAVWAASPAEIVDLFEPHEFHYIGGRYHEQLFRYRLFVPRSLKPGERCPLLVWLHGHGEHGSDNVRNLRWLELVLDDRKHIEQYRFFILAPQSPDGNWSYGRAEGDSPIFAADHRSATVPDHKNRDSPLPDDMLTVTAAILQKTIQEYPVAPDQVCLSGVSSGGTACWEMAMRHPDWFAAVVPMGSRGGDLSRAATLVNIPIWAFHNLNDQERPPEEVKAMVAAVNAAGGNAHLTLLEGKWRESSEAWSEWWWSHDCWSEAFRDYHINAWMLAQNRSAWICWSPPGGGRPWQWWHVPTALASLLAIGWLGWRWRRRRRNRLLVAQPPSAVQMADTAEGGCATSPNPSSPSEANHEH